MGRRFSRTHGGPVTAPGACSVCSRSGEPWSGAGDQLCGYRGTSDTTNGGTPSLRSHYGNSIAATTRTTAAAIKITAKWSIRRPVLRPRQQAKLARGAEDEEHAMSHKLNSGITVVGIDISNSAVVRFESLSSALKASGRSPRIARTRLSTSAALHARLRR